MADEDFEEPLRTPQPKIILPSPIALEKAELTQEEQDHNERIAAMASEDFTLPYPLDQTQMIPHKREPEITEEEREHIARIAAMAAEDFNSSIPVEQSVQVSSEPVLTEEEQRHIERVAAMAADDFHAPEFVSSKPPQRLEPELTAEERSHIERIAAMANQVFAPSAIVNNRPYAVEPELTQEEIDHIDRIAAMASEDSKQPHLVPPSQPKPVEFELSQDEKEHIARISSMAEDFSVPIVNTAAAVTKHPEPDLTQEEKDHIARITELANQDFDTTKQVSESYVPSEPELTQEEIDHIAKIAEMAAIDCGHFSSTLQESFRDAPVQEQPSGDDPSRTSEIDHILDDLRYSEVTTDYAEHQFPISPEVYVRVPCADGIKENASHDVEANQSSASTKTSRSAEIVQEATTVTYKKENVSLYGADIEKSFDQVVAYERSSPLLEPVEEPILEKKEPELTQEEIGYISQHPYLFEQSSFEQIAVPITPVVISDDKEDFSSHQKKYETDEEDLKLTKLDHTVKMNAVSEEDYLISAQEYTRANFGKEKQFDLERSDSGDRSSATSGADTEKSFDEDSSLQRSTPYLEHVQQSFIVKKEPELTQEELDHIARIQSLAEQSSFDQVIEAVAPSSDANRSGSSHQEEGRSSSVRSSDYLDTVTPLSSCAATPILTNPKLVQEELDHIAFVQKMAEHFTFEDVETPILTKKTTSHSVSDNFVSRERDESGIKQLESPVLSPVDEFNGAELTQKKLDHITKIQEMANQSSFKAVCSPVQFDLESAGEPSESIKQNLNTSTNIEEKQSFPSPSFAITTENTTRLNNQLSEDQSSPTSGADMERSIDFDQNTSYEYSCYEPSQPIIFEQVEQNNYAESPTRIEDPSDSKFLTTAEMSKHVKKEISEDRSSATSAADSHRSFDSELSEDREYVDQDKQIEGDEQLLTQEELDHIAMVQRMAEQSSFEQFGVQTVVNESIEKQKSEENNSSATSGADVPSSFDVLSPIPPEPLDDHDTTVQRLATDASIEISNLSSNVAVSEQPSIVFQTSQEHSSATSGADIERSFDGISPLPNFNESPEMTCDEMNYVLLVTHMAETVAIPALQMEKSTIRQGILPQTSEDLSDVTSGADTKRTSSISETEAKRNSDQSNGLTEEELKHIAEVLRKAEASSAASGMFERDSNLPPLRRTSITYTSHFSPSVIREFRSSTSFSSAPVTTEEKEEEGTKPKLKREPSTQVVYTDHFLRDLQSINASLEKGEDDTDVAIEEISNDRDNASSPLPEEDEMITDVYQFDTGTSLHVQQYVMQQSTFQEASGLHLSPIRRTMSAACTAEKHIDEAENIKEREVKHAHSHDQIKKRAEGEPNAYELLEQHSFRHTQPLLCNVDFLWRLNFAANRMTEEIAEEVG
ncbi:hypothetical protein CRE_10762 [Caenorhabditis remanei]|uniref:Uncharacterized protein n=1 Tax=Caenorhabditis remanei TaxID=31234 RepID=E3NT25_CAERE|nr:hypothetical protein CRE_10762 [Caenorhabditis remanei]